ncbi:MAG: hypothetical protein LBN35_01720, partial [Clostridiales Family XIII bacterium]|nr:hypothetical protein [Clostridiales Family XIII bacterium]
VVEIDDYTVLEHFGTFDGHGTRSAHIAANHNTFARLIHIGTGQELTFGEQYVVTPGSTIITLSEASLKTLPVGEHRFSAEYITEYSATNVILDLTVEAYEDDDNNDDNGGNDNGNPDENDGTDNGNTGENDGTGDTDDENDDTDNIDDEKSDKVSDDDPAAGTSAGSGDGVPNTGDEHNQALWISLMCVSGMGIAIAAFWRRKRQPTENRA